MTVTVTGKVASGLWGRRHIYHTTSPVVARNLRMMIYQITLRSNLWMMIYRSTRERLVRSGTVPRYMQCTRRHPSLGMWYTPCAF